MVSLAISHSAASWLHVFGTLLLCLAFRRGRALIKNSFFCWLPLNVCQHFYFKLCAVSATGYWMTLFSHGLLSCVLSEETVALRMEGSGVVLRCQLPHLIGIVQDLLSTRIILYYLKVRGAFGLHRIVSIFLKKSLPPRTIAFINWSVCLTADCILYRDLFNLPYRRAVPWLGVTKHHAVRVLVSQGYYTLLPTAVLSVDIKISTFFLCFQI